MKHAQREKEKVSRLLFSLDSANSRQKPQSSTGTPRTDGLFNFPSQFNFCSLIYPPSPPFTNPHRLKIVLTQSESKTYKIRDNFSLGKLEETQRSSAKFFLFYRTKLLFFRFLISLATFLPSRVQNDKFSPVEHSRTQSRRDHWVITIKYLSNASIQSSSQSDEKNWETSSLAYPTSWRFYTRHSLPFCISCPFTLRASIVRKRRKKKKDRQSGMIKKERKEKC